MANLVKRLVLAGRWLLVPIYVGMCLLLLLIAGKFFIDLAHIVTELTTGGDIYLTLAALTLLDLVLVANLIVMIMFSSFDNFVARFDLGDDQHGLSRLMQFGVGSIKVRIVSAAAVISAVYVLEVMFTAESQSESKLIWVVVLHLTLVATALLFTVLDRLERH